MKKLNQFIIASASLFFVMLSFTAQAKRTDGRQITVSLQNVSTACSSMEWDIYLINSGSQV